MTNIKEGEMCWDSKGGDQEIFRGEGWTGCGHKGQGEEYSRQNKTNKKNPAWQRHSLPVVETVNGSFYVQYRVLKVNTEEKLWNTGWKQIMEDLRHLSKAFKLDSLSHGRIWAGEWYGQRQTVGTLIRATVGEVDWKGVSVQFSHIWPLRLHGLQHTRPPSPSQTPIYPNSCPLSRWCHPIISSYVVPFSSCPQSFPASGSFQMS